MAMAGDLESEVDGDEISDEPDETEHETQTRNETRMRELESLLQTARANGEDLPDSFYAQAYRARALWGQRLGHDDIRVVGEDENTVVEDEAPISGFDRAAPTLHSYLGEVGEVRGAAGGGAHAELERVANAQSVDDAPSTSASSPSFTKTMRIQILCCETYVLFPGDTFPLFLGDEEEFDAFSHGASHDARRVVSLATAARNSSRGFFGVVCVGAWAKCDKNFLRGDVRNPPKPNLPMVGTLAEIRKIGGGNGSVDSSDDPTIGHGVVAKGVVRFMVKDPSVVWNAVALDRENAVVDVEVVLLSDAVRNPSSRGINPRVTPHSRNVYEMFDPHVLAERLARSPALNVVLGGGDKKNGNDETDETETNATETHSTKVATCPALLSHRVASAACVSPRTRYKLLCSETVVDRLKAELALFVDVDTNAVSLKCKSCDRQISSLSKVISMSDDGPSSSYCNPAGIVHDLLTVSNVHRNTVALEGTPTADFSWFPGFKWTCAFCLRCRQHLGWEFSRDGEESGEENGEEKKQQRFFGFTRDAIVADGFKRRERTENLEESEGVE